MNAKKVVFIVLVILLLISAGVILARQFKPSEEKTGDITTLATKVESTPTITATPTAVSASPSRIPAPTPITSPVPTAKPVATPTPTPQVTPTPTPAGPKSYTLAEVAKHSSSSSCWSVVNGKVYDLTSWIGKHPGGEAQILDMCGKDSSSAFSDQHGGDRKPANELAGYEIGVLIK